MGKAKDCLYSMPDLKLGTKRIEYNCMEDGTLGSLRKIEENECENCPRYKYKYIQYPLTINKIENDKISYDSGLYKCGKLCSIRPCGEEYGDKTYLGLLLGDLPTNIYNTFNDNSGILSNKVMTNPGIYVFELNKIIFGYESWWSVIESPEDLKDISDSDIDNTWYVKLLKKLNNEEE